MDSKSLSELQQRFINYITGHQSSLDSDVAIQPPLSVEARLSIYKSAYFLRLKESIETDHEILSYYLGDDLFDLMVQQYIDKHPSTYTSLRYFCDSLPSFLKDTPPFNEHPIIAELALFERRLLTAFDAPDSNCLKPEALATIQPQDWPSLKINFHPSVQLADLQYNTAQTWQALKREATPPAAEKQAQHWLIWRNKERITEFYSLEQTELHMLKNVLSGYVLADICESLAEFMNVDDISPAVVTIIQQWLNNGMIRSLDVT